jgi:hypothetical protein
LSQRHECRVLNIDSSFLVTSWLGDREAGRATRSAFRRTTTPPSLVQLRRYRHHYNFLIVLGSPTLLRVMCQDPTLVDACPPRCRAAGGLWPRMRLYPSTVQLPLVTSSPNYPGEVFVRWRGSCLDVLCLTLPQSTFVCPSLVDALPTSPAVLSCGWWSVDEDATVTVQRTAGAFRRSELSTPLPL